MSTRPLSVAINADTKQAQAATRDLSKALDDTADTLDDLAREAQRGGDKTERALDDMGDAGADAGRDIEKAGDRVERSFRDLVRDAGKAEKAVKDVGDVGPQSLDKVADGAKELQGEFAQNLGGAVSSFSGDLGDLGQIGQDTLGGLAATVASMGPAGLVGAFALAAGALGLGAVKAGMEETAEKTEAMSAAAAEWAGAFEASAGRVVSASSVVAGIQKIINDPELYADAERNAEDWGTTITTAMQAMAGDTGALTTAQETLNAKQREWVDILKESSTGSGSSYDRSAMTEEQAELGRQVERGTEALRGQNAAMAEGAERARNQAEALYDYAQRVGKASGETDDLGNKILTMPDGLEIVVDANTKTAYTDLDAVEHYRMNDKRVRVVTEVDDSAWRNWRPTTKRGHVQAVGGKHNVSWE